MTTPLVSILIPCHNSARWVGPAIASALGQPSVRLEVIAVDDGSTDGTLAELRRNESARVKVIATSNRGASASRNTALGAAQGRFIQFLDADDFLSPTKIGHQLKTLDDCDEVVSFGSATHFYDGEEPSAGMFHEARLSPQLQDPREFQIDLLGGNGVGWMVQTGQWLTPRKIIERAGPWNEHISVDDDGEFFSRVVLNSKKVLPCPESLCYYRKFRIGKNLSARAFSSRQGAESLLASTRLKEAQLLGRTSDARATRAVARLYSNIAINSFPHFAEISLSASIAARRLGYRVSIPDGSKLFRIVAMCVGWKLARRAQAQFRKERVSKDKS